MDPYSQLVMSNLEWLYGKPGSLLVLLAAIPLVWLIIQFRLLSLIAIGVIGGGIVLLYGGVDGLTVAVLVISLISLLIVIDTSLMRRRLTQLENSMNAMAQAIRGLEVAEERWQGFVARQQLPGSTFASLEVKRVNSQAIIANEDGPQSAASAEPAEAVEHLPNRHHSSAQKAELHQKS